jgi:hypothetical protein
VDFLGTLHLQNFSLRSARIIGFGTSERAAGSERQESLHYDVIVQEVDVSFLRGLGQIVKVLDEVVIFLFHLLEISSFRRFVFKVNIVKIRKINIHFAYVVEKLGSVECSFRLKNNKNCYITSVVDRSEFDKEFCDFSLLENQNFCN